MLLAVTSGCAERAVTTHRLFDGRLEVALPDNYTLYERPDFDGHSSLSERTGRVEFVTFGGNAALSKKFSDHPFDPAFLDRFAGVDVQASILLYVQELVPTGEPSEWNFDQRGWIIPRNATARAIHDRICESFSSRWGELSFAYFDPKTRIGRCVNYAGAFVSLFVRRVRDSLVIVGGMDFVEAFVFEHRGPWKAFLKMTPEGKWKAFRDVANADVAEQALMSAKIN